MPRKPAFNIKMTGRRYGADGLVPTGYMQTKLKFQGHKMRCQISVQRVHPYMRLDQGKPLLHRGRKNRG